MNAIDRLATTPAVSANTATSPRTASARQAVRADEEGSFTLYPVPGHWRLLAWVPSVGRTDGEVEVGSADLEVRLELR